MTSPEPPAPPELAPPPPPLPELAVPAVPLEPLPAPPDRDAEPARRSQHPSAGHDDEQPGATRGATAATTGV